MLACFRKDHNRKTEGSFPKLPAQILLETKPTEKLKILPIGWLLSNLLERSSFSVPCFQLVTGTHSRHITGHYVRLSHWRDNTKEWITKIWLLEQGMRHVNETASGNWDFYSPCCVCSRREESVSRLFSTLALYKMSNQSMRRQKTNKTGIWQILFCSLTRISVYSSTMA